MRNVIWPILDIIQFCFPTMQKEIGEMWHYLRMPVSILDWPNNAGT